jgi:hypothetical protein
MGIPDSAARLTERLCEQFAALPQVEAVALGGSRGRDSAGIDSHSDIDLYVYTHADIALDTRRSIVQRVGGASRADLGMAYWGPSDGWFDAASGIEIDVVFFDADWMAQTLERVIQRHEADMGYTTCFWHTVRQSQSLFDRSGWFAGLQQQCAVPYPEPLRQKILALNHPLLRGVIPAYAYQIEKAAKRGDLLSLNHRLAALFASYFDCLFAANRLLHPGEKRQLEFALARCTHQPQAMAADIEAVLHASVADLPALPGLLGRLLDRLDAALADAAV